MATFLLLVTALVVIVQCVLTQEYMPPKFIHPYRPGTEYFQENQDARINCTAQGKPSQMRYDWKRDGQKISPGGRFAIDRINGFLTIQRFTHEDEGKYQCIAENTIASGVTPVAVSPVINLKQVRLGQGTNNPPVPVNGEEGDYISLKCTDPLVSVPKGPLNWYIESTGKAIIASERTYIDNKGTLHFIYLERGDAEGYRCGVLNSQVGSINLGTLQQLTVKPIDGKPTIRPKNVYYTSPALFLRTQTAELECVFSGYPAPTVTWYDDSGRPISSRGRFELVDFNRKLKIRNVTEDDEGRYSCKGENSASETVSTFMDVTSGPIWVQGMSYITVPEDKVAKFPCKTRPSRGENPIADPVWYINGEVIRPESAGDNIQFSDLSRILMVSPLRKPADIMCIQCNVSNDVGYEFDNACLNVIEPIVIEEEPPRRQDIEKGDRVQLTVKGKTDPSMQLKYRWLFQNKTYENDLAPPFVNYDDVTKEAYIDTSQLNDDEFDSIQGIYYRELYHQYDSRTVPIEVLKVSTGPLLGGAGSWWWIVVIVLLVLVIALIILICCCCRKKDEGDYKVYKTEINVAYLDPDKDLEDHKFHDVSRIEGDPETGRKHRNMGPVENGRNRRNMGPDYDLSGDDADSMDQYGGRW